MVALLRSGKLQPPGVEPGPLAWKARILTVRPRLRAFDHNWTYKVRLCARKLVRVGFEPTPPKRLRPERSALDHSATSPSSMAQRGRGHAGARTQDLRLIRATLYRLSYTTQ